MSEYCKNCKELADRLEASELKLRNLKLVLQDYNAAARKFIEKVRTGRARSTETYNDLRRCLFDAAAAWEE